MKRSGASLAVWLASFTLAAMVGFFIFMPFFSGCRPSPNAHCMSNQKQLMLGLLIYAEDWAGKLPARDAWMDAVAPTLKSDSILHCPTVWKESDRNPNLYGYAFEGRLSEAQIGDVADPDSTIGLYDSINFARNASDLCSSMPVPPRHGSGGNPRNVAAFLSGRVKALGESEAATLKPPVVNPRSVKRAGL